MYEYLLSQLPVEWFDKHEKEIISMAHAYFEIDLVAEAIRFDIKVERPICY